MKCVDHPDKDIRFVLSYLHGRKNASSINVTVACSLECMQNLLDPTNDEGSVSYIDTLARELDGKS